MKQQSLPVPFEVYNNIAALLHQQGDNTGAQKWCEELIKNFVPPVF